MYKLSRFNLSKKSEKDKYECYQWAKQNSGFEPKAPPTAKSAPPPRQAQKGGAARGAAGGALLGFTVGAIEHIQPVLKEKATL
ncbi:MAG: hypothetical protein PF690_01540 [Deltaproteobacteria bacterium]|nr:hypothetical protein [Deltaproteobacteria bacterium]